MTNDKDVLAATDVFLAAKRRVAAAKTAVQAAEDAVARSQAADTPDGVRTMAAQTLAQANTELSVARAELLRASEQLGVLDQPTPQDPGSVCKTAVEKVKPLIWCIAGGLLALGVLFLLLAIFDQSLWSSGTGTSISRVKINAWIGVAAAALGICLLAIVTLLNRVTQGGGIAAPRVVPRGKIVEAAQRITEANSQVTSAQADVDKLRSEVASAGDDQDKKAKAEQGLSAAMETLGAAQIALRFEQDQFALATCGHSQFGGAGTWSLNYLVFGTLGLVVLIFLMYGMFNKELLPSLASMSVSRGLITFLIAVITVTIALILVLATVVSDSPDLDNRFTQGKEVLTMLIGVLGTIVGFYFGNSTEGAKPLSISPPAVSDENPVGGKPINIMSVISGGRPPYSYHVNFKPDVIRDQDGQSRDGRIRLTGLRTDEVPADTDVTFQIHALDSDGNAAARDGSLQVKAPQGAAKPEAASNQPTEPPAPTGRAINPELHPQPGSNK
ncbi:MAG TPA: hypothetical protein VHY91_01340 [Pirellulales bacterium]|jgi:hypothetical protein|nr:hypothetical protein [Pirellulales bacterium]